MAYTDVISLANAKVYLRIDSGDTTDDTLITNMISSVLSYVEQYTQHIMFAREVTTQFVNQEARVYKFPINSVTSPTGTEVDVLETYSIYTTDNSDNKTLTVNVGYSDPADIPQPLIDFAYGLLDLYYYQKEGGKAQIPDWMYQSIDMYKRFIF